MNRDLLALPAGLAAHPMKLKQADAIGTEPVNQDEHGAAKDRDLKSQDRFKRYKKALQKRARSIF